MTWHKGELISAVYCIWSAALTYTVLIVDNIPIRTDTSERTIQIHTCSRSTYPTIQYTLINIWIYQKTRQGVTILSQPSTNARTKYYCKMTVPQTCFCSPWILCVFMLGVPLVPLSGLVCIYVNVGSICLGCFSWITKVTPWAVLNRERLI